MSVGFGIGPHGHTTVGVYTPLLGDSKKTPVVIKKSYTALTEKQAEMFLNGEKYSRYAGAKFAALYYYMDGSTCPKMQRKFKSGCGDTRLTQEEINRLKPRKLADMRKSDKRILMTEGIGGLPPARQLSFESPCPFNMITEMGRTTADEGEGLFCCCVFCLPIVVLSTVYNWIFYNPDKNPGTLTAGRVIAFF